MHYRLAAPFLQIIIIGILVSGCGGNEASTSGATTGATAQGGAGGGTGGNATGGSGGNATGGSGGNATGGGGAGDLDAFTPTVAASICDALSRCCDAGSVSDYFAPWANNTLLADFTAKIPPQHPFAGAHAPPKQKLVPLGRSAPRSGARSALALLPSGTSCDGTDHCAADGDAPLALGDDCVDNAFNLLGICQQSFCDLLGTGTCQPLKANDSDCTGGDECQSAACVMGKCGESTFCTGP